MYARMVVVSRAMQQVGRKTDASMTDNRQQTSMKSSWGAGPTELRAWYADTSTPVSAWVSFCRTAPTSLCSLLFPSLILPLLSRSFAAQ